jgi:hypothetical protein
MARTLLDEEWILFIIDATVPATYLLSAAAHHTQPGPAVLSQDMDCGWCEELRQS